jgi:plastocyanin
MTLTSTTGHLAASRLSTVIALAVLAGCSGGTAINAPPDGGATGGDTDGGAGAAPPTAAVSVGNNVFTSRHNGSANPAVDTTAAGGTVTWTWTNTGGEPHSIRSLGLSIFRNSQVKSGDGSTYQARFARPGTYLYDCAIHGAAMTGTIVVR